MNFRKKLVAGIPVFYMIFCCVCLVSADDITFYHHDILGTPLATTGESGDVTWWANYYPYGSKHAGSSSDTDPQRFTGKEFDEELGLYYFGARYYNPTIARFISVDPEGGHSENPQTWNRYAYTLNNPYKYVDPDGQWPESAVGIASLAWSSNNLKRGIPGSTNSIVKLSYTMQKIEQKVSGLANNPLVQQSVNALTTVSENSKSSPVVSAMGKILNVVGTGEKLSAGKATWSDVAQLGLSFVKLGPWQTPYTLATLFRAPIETMYRNLKLHNTYQKNYYENLPNVNQPAREHHKDEKKKSSD